MLKILDKMCQLKMIVFKPSCQTVIKYFNENGQIKFVQKIFAEVFKTLFIRFDTNRQIP